MDLHLITQVNTTSLKGKSKTKDWWCYRDVLVQLTQVLLCLFISQGTQGQGGLPGSDGDPGEDVS